MADADTPRASDEMTSQEFPRDQNRPVDRGSERDGRPPTLAASVVRHPVLILVAAALFAAAGIAVGLARKPNYKASVEINVGVPDISSQATPGYSQAAITLAQSYSREADSVETWRPAAQALHLPVATVAAALTGSTVPSSPTFYIHATSKRSQQAIQIATAVTTALVHKINVLDQGEGATPALLATYARQQSKANELESSASSLSKTSQDQAAIGKARTAAAVASLEAQATASQYISAATSSKGAIIDILSPATSASSDRSTYTERYAIVGLIVGLVVGLSIAYLVSTATDRRRRRLA